MVKITDKALIECPFCHKKIICQLMPSRITLEEFNARMEMYEKRRRKAESKTA